MITKDFIAGEKNLMQDFFSQLKADNEIILIGGGMLYSGITDCLPSMGSLPTA